MHKAYETDRLVLKTLNSEAAPVVLAFYNENKEVFEPWEPLRSDHFYTLSYHKASLTAEYNYMAEGKLIRFWVFQKDNMEEIVGSVCFQNIMKDPYHSCGIGYKFASKYQHQGYAFESIQRGMDIMFKEYLVHRIEAHIMPANKPSLGLMDKLSFQYEGISYSYAKINGKWEDHKRYSALNPV